MAEALGRVTDYVKNPEKTNSGDLIMAYQCNPPIADQEFLFSKRQYVTITSRERRDNDVIAYHLWQSFKPGEITPELVNKISYDLAMSLTKGKHAFIVCTHSEAAILERISGKRIIVPKGERTAPNLLIDIQSKIQQARSPGYERWASVFNAKEMAKTLEMAKTSNYLTEHGLLAYTDLEAACDAAAQKYHDLSERTKANNTRMKEISELQKHIGAYHKTCEIYAQYRRLPPKK